MYIIIRFVKNFIKGNIIYIYMNAHKILKTRVNL
jgi:hypothetical protein